MRRSAKLLGALGVAGVAAIGGSAFTASTTLNQNQLLLGTNETSVTGGVIDTIKYNVAGVGTATRVTSITLVLLTDTHDSSVDIVLKDGSGYGSPILCGVGTYDGTSKTTYTCPGTGSISVDPDGVIETQVIVH